METIEIITTMDLFFPKNNNQPSFTDLYQNNEIDKNSLLILKDFLENVENISKYDDPYSLLIEMKKLSVHLERNFIKKSFEIYYGTKTIHEYIYGVSKLSERKENLKKRNVNLIFKDT